MNQHPPRTTTNPHRCDVCGLHPDEHLTTPAGTDEAHRIAYTLAGALFHWLTADPGRLAEFTAYMNADNTDLPDVTPAQFRVLASVSHDLLTPYCNTPIEIL